MLYPVNFLNVFAFFALAAVRAAVAEGAELGLFMDTFLNGKNLKLFLRFCPMTMIESSLNVFEILAILCSFDEDITSSLGNHVFSIRIFDATVMGFLLFPVLWDTTTTGVFFSRFAILMISSIIILCPR
jgi:hypothetical protein